MTDQRRGDFAEFATARRPQYRRLAFALCGDWHAAEDIVQNVFARVYVAWPRLRRAGVEDAYVRRAITRAAIDDFRRPWRRERSGLEGFDHPTGTGVDPGDRQDLIAALLQLPETQRRCVVLRHWLGLSVAETAEDLRIPEGTVKSHTARALERLHYLMTEEGTPR